jgi:hypothetical protein
MSPYLKEFRSKFETQQLSSGQGLKALSGKTRRQTVTAGRKEYVKCEFMGS